MKVAVVFAGLPRFVSKCHRTIHENLLSQLPDYDIFANLQWNTDMIGKVKLKPDLVLNGKVIVDSCHKPFEKDEGKEFIELYGEKIKKVNFIDLLDFDTTWLTSTGDLHGQTLEFCQAVTNAMKCQYQSLHEAVKLIDNLQDYTHIIRMRTDLIFERKIDPLEILCNFTVIQDSYKHGYDRRLSDFFFVCPTEHVTFFEELADIEKHFSGGMMHVHLLMERIASRYKSIDRELDVVIPPGDYYGI